MTLLAIIHATRNDGEMLKRSARQLNIRSMMDNVYHGSE